MKSSRSVPRSRHSNERRFGRERSHQPQTRAGEGSDPRGNPTRRSYPLAALENLRRSLCRPSISVDYRKVAQKSAIADPEPECQPVADHWQVPLHVRIATMASPSSVIEAESDLNHPIDDKTVFSAETREIKRLDVRNSWSEQDNCNVTIVERDESMHKDSREIEAHGQFVKRETNGKNDKGITNDEVKADARYYAKNKLNLCNVSNMESVQLDIHALQLGKSCTLARDMCRLEVAFDPQLEDSQAVEKSKHVEDGKAERILNCPKALIDSKADCLAMLQEPAGLADSILAWPLGMDKDEDHLAEEEEPCIISGVTRKHGKEHTDWMDTRERKKDVEQKIETNLGQDRGKCLGKGTPVMIYEQGFQSLCGNGHGNSGIVSTKADIGSNAMKKPCGVPALPATGSQESHMKVQAPVRHHDKLHIIFDLNGVLIKRWNKRPLKAGLVKENKKWIQFRPGCVEFLRRAFLYFHVGIWSTMRHANVIKICSFLEEEAHQRLPFFMTWSEDKCYRHKGIVRPDKAHVLADFKPLSLVCEHFHPYAGCHNTILVDDSPYKACMNNPNNCVFPEPFEGSDDDNYLNDVLWPYLVKMAQAPDIRVFIADCRIGQLPVTIGHDLHYHLLPVIQEWWDPDFSPALKVKSKTEDKAQEKILCGKF